MHEYLSQHIITATGHIIQLQSLTSATWAYMAYYLDCNFHDCSHSFLLITTIKKEKNHKQSHSTALYLGELDEHIVKSEFRSLCFSGLILKQKTHYISLTERNKENQKSCLSYLYASILHEEFFLT